MQMNNGGNVRVYPPLSLCYTFQPMQSNHFSEVLDLIQQEDSRFDKDAYHFVRRALDYTLKEHAEDESRASRHVTGGELLEGIREYALVQYGPLALTVFYAWNIRRCEDFGDIVFQLVDYGILGKTDRDRKADFVEVYDFERAFRDPFLPERKKRSMPRKKVRVNKDNDTGAA